MGGGERAHVAVQYHKYKYKLRLGGGGGGGAMTRIAPCGSVVCRV